MTHRGSPCREVAEKLLLFKDGELDENETEYLRRHLHMCPPCLDLLASYDEVIEILRRLRPVKLPPGLLQRLKARLPPL